MTPRNPWNQPDGTSKVLPAMFVKFKMLQPANHFIENFMNLQKKLAVFIDCGGNLQKENGY